MFYITDFFEAAYFESMYPNMAVRRQDMIPERVESHILDTEVDLCIMEQDMGFSVRRKPIKLINTKPMDK